MPGPPLLRRLFRRGRPIILRMDSLAGGGNSDDGGISGQCVFAERLHGLSAAAGDGVPCGYPASPPALCIFRRGGRTVRSGGVFAGAGVSFRLSRETGGRGFAGGDCFRRGGAVAAADAAAVCRVLRPGGLCPGAGAGDWRRPVSQRHFLYGCGRWNAVGGRHGGVCGADGHFSCRRSSWCAGRAAAGRGMPAGEERMPDGAAGHGHQPFRPGERTVGTGGVPRYAGPAAAADGAVPFDGAGAVSAGGPAGTPAPGGAGPAILPAALPGGGGSGRAAAGCTVGVDGGGRQAVSGPAGGSVAHGTGNGISRPVGRTGEKERSI